MFALLVAGCGGSSKAADPTPTSISSVAASKASPTPSVDPASDAAVLAAARAYVDAYERSLRMANPTDYLSVTTDDCSCRTSVLQTIRDLGDRHEHLDVVFQVSDLRLVVRNEERADVALEITNAEYHVLADIDGKVTETAPQSKRSFVLSLGKEGDIWRVFLVRQP